MTERVEAMAASIGRGRIEAGERTGLARAEPPFPHLVCRAAELPSVCVPHPAIIAATVGFSTTNSGRLLIRALVFGLGLFLPEQGVPAASVGVYLSSLQFRRSLVNVSAFVFGVQTLELADRQELEGRGHTTMLSVFFAMSYQ